MLCFRLKFWSSGVVWRGKALVRGRSVGCIARGWVYILVWISGVNLSDLCVVFGSSARTVVREEMKAMLVVCANQNN